MTDAQAEAYVRPLVEKAALAMSANEAWALLAGFALIALLLIPLAGKFEPSLRRDGQPIKKRDPEAALRFA